MKKLYFLAVAAATMLTGCVTSGGGNNDPNFEGDGPSAPLTNLTIRLGNMGGGVQTRSLEGTGKTSEGTNQLSNAHVFILDETGTTVVDYAAVTMTSDLEAIKGAGWIFPEPIYADSKVYVLGNVHEDYNRTVKDLASLADINDFTSDIWTQIDYNYATMANKEGTPVDMVASAAGSAKVSVEVAPVISRLELWSLQGGGNITGFSVTGVFLTDYYTAYTYGGGFSGTKIDNTDPATMATNGGMTGDDMDYPAIAQGSPLKAEMTGNRIWAYNVAARSLPLLVVRLENVMIGATLQAGPLYLTVSSYGGITEFKAGKIYRIQTLSFTEENLALAPIADGGITAEPQEWDIDDLTPDIKTPSAKIAITPDTVSDWAADGTTPETFTVTLPAALTAWSVVINQEDDYFTASPDNGTGTGTGNFTIAPAAANTSVFARVATVRVDGTGDNGATGTSNLITVKQEAAAAEMAETPSPGLLTFAQADGSGAGTGDIEFESNVAFSVTLTGADADKFILTGDIVEAATPDKLTIYTINVVPVDANTSGGNYTASVIITNTDGNGAAPVEIELTHSGS